ncbi:GntR family transcriptional regulator [Pseudomonas tremae]|uniref:GntR-family transcriptional regulator n=5 Tax=Pseudomonas syringae group TaxID=136849 RepID=A0AB37QLN9_9PSED|nr:MULTISPECIES: GntR family transcriptional regulator [Pseudomonas syringae group]KPW38769.1 putative GntR-family transcriptional regulator [Pseudomonas coronafaciens pv. atropurpurea]KPX30409.1 putative GntR-family transcriptional regulator [Pseudomonas coronafaciens pv. garcae]KPY04357.1 putative GntR-family transcriptional regulator [Pseudomonas coronafaciens pv. oryzae]KPY92036.1 putative GntR-family transcriptional regulator [Pseudomonas tremae]KPZ25603.1 putative GntR-family transcripti
MYKMTFLSSNIESRAAGLSAVEVLASKLKARILNGDFEPGEFLRDFKMAEEYEVARNTFRSAAQLLVSFGLLLKVPNRGFCIPEFGPNEIVDIARLRGVLETEAVRMIILNGVIPEDALSAVEKLRNAPADSPRSDIVTADGDFHRAIIRASGSPRLQRSYAMLESEIELLLVLQQPCYEDPKDIVADHEHLIECLRSRDFETARAAFVEHWEDLSSKLLRANFERRR